MGSPKSVVIAVVVVAFTAIVAIMVAFTTIVVASMVAYAFTFAIAPVTMEFVH